MLFATYSLLIIWIIGFTILNRKSLSLHTGMMISMSLGMIIGLGVGTFIGLLYPDYFFQATFTSVLIGSVIGFASGLPVSLTACLDGLLAGVMGGMMGAMLGVMLPTETADHTIKLMAVLSGGTLFIVFLMMQSEVTKKRNKCPFLLRPSSFFFAVCLFLFTAHQYHFADIKESHQRNDFNLEHDKVTYHEANLTKLT